MNKNQKVDTILGTVILIVVAVTATAFVMKALEGMA